MENKKLSRSCAPRPVNPDTNPCVDPIYLSSECRKYPVQLVKYVRISLEQVTLVATLIG